MRIGVFFNDASIPTAGGAFTQREAITEALLTAKSEHEFFYFCYGKKPTGADVPNYVALRGKKFAWLLKQAYYFTGLAFFKKLIPLNRALAKEKIDLVYFVEPNYQPTFLPYIASVWDIAHVHIPFFPEMHMNEEWEKREIMYQRYLRKASFVIATTRAAREDIVRQYVVPDEKVRFITSPIADAYFKKNQQPIDVHKKYSLPQGYFVYPAQLWPHKNHSAIIQALARLQQVYRKKAHVAFVGSDKGNRAYLEAEARTLGVESQVHFLGFVPTPDLIALYRHAVACLYLTFVDAEGLPPAEAFVLGCPVISSNIPCLDSQLGDAALLVPPLAPDELADAMMSVTTNARLRANLIRKGTIAAKDLRKEHFAKEILKVFDEFAAYRKRWE